jgi:hypothetical protein
MKTVEFSLYSEHGSYVYSCSCCKNEGDIDHSGTYVLASEANERVKELEDKYNELIFAVHTKYQEESRHETALRYIKEKECHGSLLGICNDTTSTALEVKP